MRMKKMEILNGLPAAWKRNLFKGYEKSGKTKLDEKAGLESLLWFHTDFFPLRMTFQFNYSLIVAISYGKKEETTKELCLQKS